MFQTELEVRPDQVIVVYTSDDTGDEIDTPGLLGQIAEDAASRARDGHQIVSMAAIPQRHAGLDLGRQGSGIETKVSIAVVHGQSR